MDDQLLREFLAEADERIEALFADIERLRRAHSGVDGRARRALIARIFRHVHTLKGSAATLPQLAPVSGLAHEFENLLDAVRSGRAPLSEAVIDTCEEATNALAVSLAAARDGDATFELSPAVFRQLRHHATATTGGHALPAGEEMNQPGACAATITLPSEITRSLSAVESRHLSESLKEGARAMLLAAAFDLASLDEHFTRFTGALGDCGEIISTFPGDPSSAPDEISFHLLYTTTCTRAELESLLAPFGANITWTGDTANETAGDARPRATVADAALSGEEVLPVRAVESSVADVSDVTGVSNGADVSGITIESRAAGERDEAGEPRPPIFVRVPLHELDELVTATHELFTDTLAVLEHAPAPDAAPEEGEAAARRERLREDFGALEERVMGLRMQPLLPVLERAARAARIAARAAGKEIKMEVAGGEVRVDRSLAEQVGEPLLHLLRNAIDHGIETAEERRAAGKPARGRVRLEVRAEGSRVRVCVADDGRGVDTERVARVAVSHGLLEANSPITDEQALRLIFRPGFSTAGTASAVSGRGVGLDAVEHSLERAGGEVRVRTARGVGTAFELRVPLALSLVSAIVVRAGEHAYAIDAGRVVETGYLKTPDIVEGGAQARWRGRQLSLVSLAALLGQAPTMHANGAGGAFPVLVVRRGRDDEADAWHGGQAEAAESAEQFIILVDDIEGERETLVRSLGRHATRWRGISGASAQRDGTVALLLDLPRLLERVAAAGEARG